MDWFISLAALAGTALQTVTSIRETGRANRAVLENWLAEDSLVEELPAWRYLGRRRRRKELVAMRTPEEHRVIQHLNRVMLGWVLLDFAAAAAFLDAVL